MVCQRCQRDASAQDATLTQKFSASPIPPDWVTKDSSGVYATEPVLPAPAAFFSLTVPTQYSGTLTSTRVPPTALPNTIPAPTELTTIPAVNSLLPLSQ